MTDKEIIEKTKAFMDKEVAETRKMRDWEWFKNNEDLTEYKKSAMAWISSICMFTQTLVDGYGAELVAYADKCHNEIANL